MGHQRIFRSWQRLSQMLGKTGWYQVWSMIHIKASSHQYDLSADFIFLIKSYRNKMKSVDKVYWVMEYLNSIRIKNIVLSVIYYKNV